MSKNDGGPAFPVTSEFVKNAPSLNGMSLRDWFAGQALPSVIEEYARLNPGIGTEHLPRNCAGHAYRIADAMLAEREKGG